MYKKMFLFSAMLLLILLINGCSPVPSKYRELIDPRIVMIPDQKMLTLELTGDPNVTMPSVGILYKIYFKLKFEGKKMVPPRARWPKPFKTPKDQWVGIWGLPVAESVAEVPELSDGIVKPEIRLWEYGQYGEILHLGPYDQENPTIERLKSYLLSNGMEILPETHEEEYIRGPGMFGKGNPKKYLTIIRYKLKPAAQ